MNRTVSDIVAETERATRAIWLECPDEITKIREGHSARGTGTRGQFFTTLVFAEAESRTLSDGLLWGLVELIDAGSPDLRTLTALTDTIVSEKAQFFEFLGLSDVCERLDDFVAGCREAQTLEELRALVIATMGYVNRVQMWIDVVFPWGVANEFRRVS